MLKRILTALWGVPLILWIVHLGDQVFFILIEAIACFGLFEFYNLLEKRGYRPLNLEGIALGFLYLVALYLEGAWAYKFLLPILILTIFIYELVNKKRSIVDISLTFLGFFYIPFLIGYILLIRKLQFGEIFTYYVLILTWISDSCAFFIGKLLGKHKLAPSISPNKTVEGTLAAVFFCTNLFINTWEYISSKTYCFYYFRSFFGNNRAAW